MGRSPSSDQGDPGTGSWDIGLEFGGGGATVFRPTTERVFPGLQKGAKAA